MVKGKRMTKKRLKEPDEFITFTDRTLIFFREQARAIAVGAAVIVVLVLAFLFFQMWDKKKEEDAARAYSAAVELYDRGAAQGRGESSAQDQKAVLAKFDEIIAKYPGTSSGKLSLLYKGEIELRLNEFDEAIKAYSAFSEKAGKRGLYQYFALEGLGHAYEGKKDYGKALEAYQKILQTGTGFQLAEAHLNMGYCYEKLGKNKEALQSFKAFLSSSPKSLLTNTILQKVSLLEKL